MVRLVFSLDTNSSSAKPFIGTATRTLPLSQRSGRTAILGTQTTVMLRVVRNLDGLEARVVMCLFSSSLCLSTSMYVSTLHAFQGRACHQSAQLYSPPHFRFCPPLRRISRCIHGSTNLSLPSALRTSIKDLYLELQKTLISTAIDVSGLGRMLVWGWRYWCPSVPLTPVPAIPA